MSLTGIKLTVKYDSSKIIKDLEELQTKALQAAAFRWEIEAKFLTTFEDHVDTGRYRASINNNTIDGEDHPTVTESRSDDGIHNIAKYNSLISGSNVEYAAKLEQRYGIFLRALDNSRQQMLESYIEVIQKGL